MQIFIAPASKFDRMMEFFALRDRLDWLRNRKRYLLGRLRGANREEREKTAELERAFADVEEYRDSG